MRHHPACALYIAEKVTQFSYRRARLRNAGVTFSADRAARQRPNTVSSYTLLLTAFFATLFSRLGKDTTTMTAPGPRAGSVFLVEDEVMIRMMVAEMLEDLGYTIVAESGDVAEAVQLAQSVRFDIAILDVNVNGKVVTPVARAIDARRLPYIFTTGYGAQGIPEEFRGRPTLQKPFQMETLASMIETAIRTAA
jgi:CheY-like chemotaxis protein